MNTYKDDHIIKIFKQRDSLETKVCLKSGFVISVWNIAWGYDIGDEYAHITSNVSPEAVNSTVDFFYTTDIEKMFDERNNEINIKE
ncbi:MAG: hypothetical protein JWQ27_2694 [Ferruginibacter sp.]|nr:hypothetical protein [Ferruginibacter sp.]